MSKKEKIPIMIETDQFILRSRCTLPQLYLLKILNRNVVVHKLQPTEKTVITLPVIIFRRMITGVINEPIKIEINEENN